ncbi:MAG: hypothetical protein ABI823_03200 [Bryobacteraceae bacterium]
MKNRQLWLILLAALVFGLAYYFLRSDGGLNVTPDAKREIEKAKQR